MTFKKIFDIYPIILIYHSKSFCYTHAANQTTEAPAWETTKERPHPYGGFLTMKKFMKNILNIRQHQQAEVQPDTAKARCYACINGIIIPVL